MGLRDFLMGAQQLQEGFKTYGQGLRQQGKDEAADQLQKEAPDLFRKYKEGTPQERDEAAARISSLSFKATGKDYFSDEVAKNLFQKDKKPSGPAVLTLDQINGAYPDKPEDVRKAAAGLPDYKAQVDALKEQGIETRGAKNRSITQEKFTNAQGEKAYGNLNKTEDAFREQDYKLKEIKQALDRGTSLDDNIAFGYIARSIAQEKGPLTDNDIARIQGATGFAGSLAEFKSKFTGDTYAKLSPQQKDNIKNVVSANARNFQDKKAETLAADLNGIYQTESRLRDENGHPTGILKQRLDQYKKDGLPVKFDETSKNFTVDKPVTKLSGVHADLVNMANSIKDPATKAQYIKSITSRAGQPISDEQANQIKAKIQAASTGAVNGP